MNRFIEVYLPLEQEIFKYTDEFYIYPILSPLIIKLREIKNFFKEQKISFSLNFVIDYSNEELFKNHFKKFLDDINILYYEKLNDYDKLNDTLGFDDGSFKDKINRDRREFIILPANTPLISYNIDIFLNFIKNNNISFLSYVDDFIDFSNFSFVFKSNNWGLVKSFLFKKVFNLKRLIEIDEKLLKNKEEILKNIVNNKELSDYFFRINNLKDIELVFEKSKKIIKRIFQDIVLLGDNIFICPLSYINAENLILDNVFIVNSLIEGKLNKIGPNCFILDSKIGSKNIISNSVIKSNKILNNNVIGPFSNLRENNEIMEGNKVGAFVELKNTKMYNKVKCSHLAYVGDAILKENVNIGAGVVFANYDGVNKYQTIIEANSFIGSNSTIIAPKVIGSNSYVGAGSVVTKDVESNTVVLGNPAKFYTTTEKLKIKKNINVK